ncbi:BglG family transcription antiterminator LicT [Enterococcus gallinarum]|uniref:BglG family transcription antiterminator LicT n=1 Tax=Enterococcus gallinarum TaxID=1353 RepID=UPI001E2D70E5|nr:PRD domain-containing protein [Enterococcus gallinarum]MCD4984858.1 PRD domain-containing protein [Enterococcus gallinarum]MDT2719827.1 PRD domain-containing protein [Enterococcus gallinarum]MDV7785408.1 PRD domain-containing protein [Enterococcus gallinarum]
MKISKVLNNNVVITTDEKQNEIIVMGRGIAFKKKVGDDISDQTIDKVYRLENRTIASQFQELLADLPLEYLELSNQVIEYAREELSSPINDSIYISLPDHLHSAIERAKKGIVVKNVLLWDIKRFFPDEFKIGKRTIEKISERYGIELPEDEAGFIALHLVNAQTENNDQSNLYELTKTMQDIINIVKYYFKTTFDEESVYFYRFTTHLRFFVSRMQNHSTHAEETDDELLEMVKIKYRNAYQCVQKIKSFLATNYRYDMSNDESLYLTIHIARLVQKNR